MDLGGSYWAIVVVLLAFFAPGPRNAVYSRDFFYFSPSYKVRRWLYIRRIPTGKIPLASLAWQWLTIITLTLQLLSLLGVNILAYPYSLYALMVFTGSTVMFFIGAFINIAYFLVCRLFLPQK